MRLRCFTAAIVVPLVLAAAVATAATPPASTAAPRLAAATHCTNGITDRINGRVVCIRVGGKCVAAHDRKYRAKGYACVNGRLRRITKPTISVADGSIAEGNSGTTTLGVPVALSASTASTVTVAYATADGSAKAGSDYIAASGTLTFAPGERAKTIPISV